jgi:CheY-like chemotaxis protein
MLKVLIIDDAYVEHFVTGALLRQLGFEVIDANCGLEGVSLALETKPNLILLDMIMPDQDGAKTCLQLRLKGYTGKIIISSGLFDNDVAYAVDQYQADGFISKPIARETLIRQLQQLGFLQPA